MVASTQQDLAGMRASGKLVRRVFELMKQAAKPGVTTQELDAIAIQEFASVGARSAPALYTIFPERPVSASTKKPPTESLVRESCATAICST